MADPHDEMREILELMADVLGRVHASPAVIKGVKKTLKDAKSTKGGKEPAGKKAPGGPTAPAPEPRRTRSGGGTIPPKEPDEEPPAPPPEPDRGFWGRIFGRKKEERAEKDLLELYDVFVKESTKVRDLLHDISESDALNTYENVTNVWRALAEEVAHGKPGDPKKISHLKQGLEKILMAMEKEYFRVQIGMTTLKNVSKAMSDGLADLHKQAEAYGLYGVANVVEQCYRLALGQQQWFDKADKDTTRNEMKKEIVTNARSFLSMLQKGIQLNIGNQLHQRLDDLIVSFATLIAQDAKELTTFKQLAEAEKTSVSNAIKAVNQAAKERVEEAYNAPPPGREPPIPKAHYADTGEPVGELASPWDVIEPPVASHASSTELHPGDYVRTTASIPVFEAPIGGDAGQQKRGATGKVIAEPVSPQGYARMVHVRFDTGQSGWVAEYFLEKIVAPAKPIEKGKAPPIHIDRTGTFGVSRPRSERKEARREESASPRKPTWKDKAPPTTSTRTEARREEPVPPPEPRRSPEPPDDKRSSPALPKTSEVEDVYQLAVATVLEIIRREGPNPTTPLHISLRYQIPRYGINTDEAKQLIGRMKSEGIIK